MADDWYYREGEAQRGPVSEASLRALLDAGAIPAESLVWAPGMSGWASAGVALNSPPAAPAVAAPVATPSGDSPRRPKNGWLLAWQIVNLLLTIPGAIILSLFPTYGMNLLLPTAATAVAAMAFVVAMFWRKKWAAYGFVAAVAIQLAFMLPVVRLLFSLNNLVAGVFSSALLVVLVANVALLAAVLRLGGSGGWADFR